MLGQLDMLFFNGYMMYGNIPEEVARGYITYILGNIYTFYPLYALLIFIITVLADMILLATTLSIIQVSITRYKRQQTQVYSIPYTYHNRRTSSTITKILFRMNEVLSYHSEYLLNYIKSRIQYIEKSLGKSIRKSRINKPSRTKQYNK
jgi:hypothetical protein